MSDYRRLALIALPALFLWPGCGPAKDAAPAANLPAGDSAAPRAVLARWQQALVAGDKSAYLACFTGSEDELVLALAGFEAAQAGYAFHDAVTRTYGPEAWKLFDGSSGVKVDLFPRDPQWPRRITVVRMGSVAFGYTPRGRVPLALSETGGAWRLHAASLVPPGIEARRAADYLFKWAAALRDLAPKVIEKKFAAEKATTDFDADLKARIAPADRPAAAAAVDAFLVQ
jgi:hypothetical protein